MKLLSSEKVLKGSWIEKDGFVQKDKVAKRIDYLIDNILIQIGVDNSGWVKLYIDPDDKRYWELSYPESEMQGGGAPLLRNIKEEEANLKYNINKGT